MPIEKDEGIHLGLLDDADHEAKIDSDAEYRKTELRIQALGAAISRRDWLAVEQAYAAIRDKFYSHSKPLKLDDEVLRWKKIATDWNKENDSLKERLHELDKPAGKGGGDGH